VPPSDRHESLLPDLQDRLEKVENKDSLSAAAFERTRPECISRIKLTPNEETIVNRLLTTNGICSKEQLYEALYLSRAGVKPDPKILREIIRFVHQKLRSHGIVIETEFGKGYTMPRESRAKLRKLAVPQGKRVGGFGCPDPVPVAQCYSARQRPCE